MSMGLRKLSVKEMEIAEAAWLAGFIDGEGSIYPAMTGKYKVWGISIANTDIIALEKCRIITNGGSLYKKTSQVKVFPKAKPQWVWKVARQRDVVYICEQMLPYLTTKRSRAEECLQELRNKYAEYQVTG